MSANEKAGPTLMWIKQLTTSTFSSLNKGLLTFPFFRRNQKILVIFFPLWILATAGGMIALSVFAGKQMALQFKQSAAVAERFADRSSTLLLEDELLGLNRLVFEFIKENKAIFGAILNHERRIVAHSQPEKLNQLYEPLEHRIELAMIDQVHIERGFLESGTDVVTFHKTITYSNVVIGSAIYGIPAESIFETQGRFRLFNLIFFTASGLLGAAVLFGVNRRNRRLETKTPAVVPQKPVDITRIGPYQLRQRIAQGGMAELYLADYIRGDGFRRTVAIKRVLPHLAENRDFINMFIREARLAALLQHPNIVQIFDFGNIQNSYFIAMEYIDGMTLGQVLAHLRSGLPVDMAVFVMTKICMGLDYSHRRKNDETGQPLGIVHRDISPQNILLSYQGEVKISDFGISKANTEPSLTQAGVIKGKLSYLSPEQALGKPVDQQADIYALGLVFYESLSATRIYQFDSDIEAIRKIPEMQIQPLSEVRNDIPEVLNAIIMKCLAKDKQQRYPDASTLLHDLLQLKNRLQIPYDASDLSTFMRTTFNHD